MSTRNLALTDYQSDPIEQLVASSRYQNASEVLREGLRPVDRRDAEEKARLLALRDPVATGIADVEAGRSRSFDSPVALRRYLAALTDQATPEKAAGSTRAMTAGRRV